MGRVACRPRAEDRNPYNLQELRERNHIHETEAAYSEEEQLESKKI